MTAPQYPAQPAYAPTRMSKSALLSLICGILGCIPFVTGALALLLGIIGFFKAGKPGVTGRWMAIVGSLLGLISIVLWTLFFGSFVALFAGVMALTQPPATATRDFIRHLNAGNVADAKLIAPRFTDEKLAQIEEYLKAQGAFKDTTFGSRNIRNTSAFIEGTAEFEKSTQDVKARLEGSGDTWELMEIEISPKR